MSPWKMVALVVLALMPGGTLLLIGYAALKALQLGKSRLDKSGSASAGNLALAGEGKAA